MAIVCLMTMVVSVNAQSFSIDEIKEINYQIITLKADYKVDLSKVDVLKRQRDEMVSTFSVGDRTIKIGMTKDEAKKVMDICGWWSKHSSSYTENGIMELIHFDAFNTFYINGDKITNDNNYMLTFENNKLTKIEVAENTADKIQTEINDLKYRVKMITK